jgi:hypothetical protein
MGSTLPALWLKNLQVSNLLRLCQADGQESPPSDKCLPAGDFEKLKERRGRVEKKDGRV